MHVSFYMGYQNISKESITNAVLYIASLISLHLYNYRYLCVIVFEEKLRQIVKSIQDFHMENSCHILRSIKNRKLKENLEFLKYFTRYIATGCIVLLYIVAYYYYAEIRLIRIPYLIFPLQKIAQVVIYIIFLISYAIPLILFGTLSFYFFSMLRILNEYILNFDNPNSSASLQLCFQLHLEIYMKFKIFKEVFSTAEAAEMVASPILILSIFLNIKLSPDVPMFYCWLIVSITQFFVLCMFGQLIFIETEEIFTNLYLTRWYQMSQNNQMTILMMMKMSRKPFGLRMLGMYDINIAMFGDVVKVCFSYCAILYTLV
ncbi:hypothetical protein DMENIID0001_075800 [Sergentomyia squamirostris]